MPSACASWS
ncbi:hypothetical protein LEMLEM_LOCUS563 [Lemmus lemmus]